MATIRNHPLLRGLVALTTVSASLRWQRVSKSAAAILRLPEPVAGTPLPQYVHPDDVRGVEQAFQKAQATRRVQRLPCRFMANGAGDGTIIATDAPRAPCPSSLVHVRLDIWAKFERAGRFRCFQCNIIDLTPVLAAKEAELQSRRADLAAARRIGRGARRDLQRLKLSYRELYQNAPAMYLSVDPAGRLVTFNDTLAETLGYERADLQGQEYAVLLASSVTPGQGTASNMPRRQDERETRWRKKDGTIIDVWLRTVAVHDEAGQIVRYRSAALDVSEKNRLAGEVRARGDELERTNHSLRTINSELEAFTHVVSHDLKEPLRTLQTYSRLLADEHAAHLGPDGFQYVHHLIRASGRLGLLIDDLLHLSRAGRIADTQRPFNLNTILATVRQDLVDLIQRKGASVSIEGSLPEVLGDSARVAQLLTNLVANGLKYNDNRSPRVVIGAKPCPDDPRRVAIFVRDNGIGIAPAFHEQIFGIFRRLHANDQYEGTGAGLAICKKIAEGHGGRIWVESDLGRGATFSFTLQRSPIVAESASEGASQSPKQAASSPHGARVVLVEDQPEVGLIIRKLGQRDGLDITWFPNAEQAWTALQRERADLLLLDINLPGMSGVALCERLRGLEHFKRTPVAMFLPEQDAESLKVVRAAGADFFLSKDLLCRPADWRRELRQLLARIPQMATP